ncbi:cytochrome c oxidase subunit 4 isoform 1, mitochondrial-like [Stomoxys calcitrans]|uniref:cytochrome c oxidase subunit 4 isoform 1, mitochondrial-like n=1 Tax=Stomoxys calcitrans TaxID=35570 RepID=UPI0027E2B6AE|nr:cytochrome c oxidase subunit 4 isoform 1, mitochondrial-like [Stomoxys calcitrans]
MALQMGKFHRFMQVFNKLPQLMMKRKTSFDYTNTMCGKPICFRESDATICALREKEKGDWKKLSKEDVKTLYRYSFCQTFAEFKAPTGEWKMHLGIGLWACAVGLLFSTFVSNWYGELPETFNEDRRQAQLKRMIALEINPIDGLASKWDYEIGDWK